MKRYKRLTTAVLAVALAAGIVTGCGSSGQDIGQDEAKRIAFADAGVSESDTSRLKVEKDRDDGMLQYDVQFSVDEKEYSYDINGANGEILSADVETNGTAAQNNTAGKTDDTADTNSGTDDTPSTNSGTAAADVAVSEADARAAALERVPGATDADIRMELEYDDGYYIYEGDVIYDQKEYEFEIDAQTGNFLKWSEERH